MKKIYLFLMVLGAMSLVSCSSSNNDEGSSTPSTEVPEDYYAGGKLGTTANHTSSCFEQFTQPVEDEGLVASFKRGESRFERIHSDDESTTTTYRGLGPVYSRSSCVACHPGYGHGHRITTYNSEEYGNACLITVCDAEGNVASSLGEVPITEALAPFKPMIDESKIKIEWKTYTDEWGNKFADGETYELIYPEITALDGAFYSPLMINGKQVSNSDAVITLQSTIGIYGTGLLDAIPDDSLKAQYVSESKKATLNPRLWNGTGFTAAALSAGGHPMRFDYYCDYANVLENASLWEVTNVITPIFPYLYITNDYAVTSSKDPAVQADFYKYYPAWNKTGNVETDIYNFLTSTNQATEMDMDACYDMGVWIRGLAVPAARDVKSETFQKGKKLFTEMGCAQCHRPSWTTGADKVVDSYNLTQNGTKAMPRYPNQKIWPYTDLIQHRLFMKNDIHTGWCRTTPLWGRGLSQIATGHSDRMHDCRARNVIEAIMWHGASNSDARWSVENFRKLSKDDRDAVVTFINSI